MDFEGLHLDAIGYLAATDQAKDPHSIGFLRYAFVNDIDLACSDIVAEAFDKKFSHVWHQLSNYLWSNLHDRTIFKYLPPTIRMMT